jgi:DNA polymerase-3 subunit gamma/tau
VGVKYMATLYRKYRPQNFKEVVNQNHIKITLEHEIESDTIAHAYLFCGPRAVGKTTIARVFSKAINCDNRKKGEHEPCNQCQSCNEISKGKSLNIIEIDAASHTGVDNVRENIINVSRISIEKGKYKVFIIDEVHMLSISAFNALLKVIEEPPEGVIFILCTTEVHKIPSTIISRCQRFDFKRINISELTKKLQFICDKEGIKIEKNILESIARHSEGHMRDAESLLGQVIFIGGKEISQKEADLVIPRSNISEVVNLIDALSRKDAGTGIGIINKTLDEGIDIKRFTIDLIEILRKLLLSKVNRNLAEKLGLELGESLEIKLNEISKNLEISKIICFIEKFLKAKEFLKGSFIIQLPLELAVIELCTGESHFKSNPNLSLNKAPEPKKNIFKQNANLSNEQKQNPFKKEGNEVLVKENLKALADNSDINIQEIKNKWNEVLVRIKKYNHSLTFILRVCEPKKVENGCLELAFKYKFHKDRINEATINSIIKNVLNEVYGLNLNIEAVIDENIAVDNKSIPEIKEEQTNSQDIESKNSKEEKDDAVGSILKTFGGKLIN